MEKNTDICSSFKFLYSWGTKKRCEFSDETHNSRLSTILLFGITPGQSWLTDPHPFPLGQKFLPLQRLESYLLLFYFGIAHADYLEARCCYSNSYYHRYNIYLWYHYCYIKNACSLKVSLQCQSGGSIACILIKTALCNNLYNKMTEMKYLESCNMM